MLHALITFAATEEGEETSKTLFYVAGGALVVFAVIVSVDRHHAGPAFPTSKGAARGRHGARRAPGGARRWPRAVITG